MAAVNGDTGRWGATGLFVGRGAELTVLSRCRARSATGEPCLVVVEGEAGIGKTALVQHALAPGPDGLTVTWAWCDKSEQDWPYALVDQWLRQLSRSTDGWHGVVELTRSSAPPLTVGAELLSVLAAAADTAPLALVVDDVPWADGQSLAALGFVLRRLWSERLLIVVTARTTPDTLSEDADSTDGEWHELPRGAARAETVRLAGLATSEVGELARARTGTALKDAGIGRLVERTGGHPLHLRTLLEQVSAQQLQDASNPLPVPASLEMAIRQQLTTLPPDSRRLVEALAVLDSQVPLVIAGTLADLPDPTTALRPTLAAGLVTWQADDPTTPVRLHHALQRDAIYQALAPQTRRDLHTTAAQLVPADTAWAHKVAAATGTDTALVEELATEAEHQAQAGRVNRAATLLLWAADLASTRDRYELHLLTAATYLCGASANARLVTLRSAIEQCAPSPRRHAILGYLVSQADTTRGDILLRHALAGGDSAVQPLARMWLAMNHLLRADGAPTTTAVAPLVSHLPAGPARNLALGLLAVAAGHTRGPTAGLKVLADSGLADEAALIPAIPLVHRGLLRITAGHLAAGMADLTDPIARQPTETDAPGLAYAHYALSLGQYLTGAWTDAAINAEHSLAWAETNHQAWALLQCHTVGALAHAQRGHWSEAQKHLDAIRQDLTDYVERATFYSSLVEAVLAQAHADYPAMLHALHPRNRPTPNVIGLRTLYVVAWAPLFIEAATTMDNPTEADLILAEDTLEAFNRLSEHAPALAVTTQWLHGRLYAATGNYDQALTAYRAGLAAPALYGDDIPLHRAFLHRDLAHHLQTAGHADNRPQATTHLRHACHMFTSLGATPYVERTAASLAPPESGAPPDLSFRIPAHTPAEGLTEREQHVAHLAAQGYTNQEIARQLLLSPKTIEYHLSHVYSKLQLTSRRQLRSAVRPAPPAGTRNSV